MWMCEVVCMRLGARKSHLRTRRSCGLKAYRIQSTWQLGDVLVNHDRRQRRKIDLYQSSFYPLRL